ncbi:MAG TPA: hypothetical protein VG267_08830 [Terracidiphilus sp.]|jgi:hypothetical protein|nr:hypothetical protein [Terracidiphilus sp.]
MPRPAFLTSRALTALKFAQQEKTGPQSVPEGLTDGPTEEQTSARERVLGPAKILKLVDRLYRAKMVTDAISGFVPRVRERVCVEGRDEVFVVIYVDRENAVADAVSMERVGDLLESVPFSAMYPAEPLKAA